MSHGECLGGALYERDFRAVCARVGFAAVREVSRSPPIAVHDAELCALLGRAVFHSVTYRLFKLAHTAAAESGDAAGDGFTDELADRVTSGTGGRRPDCSGRSEGSCNCDEDDEDEA